MMGQMQTLKLVLWMNPVVIPPGTQAEDLASARGAFLSSPFGTLPYSTSDRKSSPTGDFQKSVGLLSPKIDAATRTSLSRKKRTPQKYWHGKTDFRSLSALQ